MGRVILTVTREDDGLELQGIGISNGEILQIVGELNRRLTLAATELFCNASSDETEKGLEK